MFTRLFVGNVAYALDDATLLAELSALGLQVKNVRILKDRDTGNPRGFGFFEVDPSQTEVAIQLADGAVIGGRSIRVAVAAKQPVPGAPPPLPPVRNGRNFGPDKPPRQDRGQVDPEVFTRRRRA
jgi:RNA recognition motif-containing protein